MKLKAISMLTLATIMLASCSKDEDKVEGPIPGTGEESVVTLTIYDATVGTRAADLNTEPATIPESAINLADGIKVLVFNQNGILEYPTGSDPLELGLTETAPNSGIYRSDPFKVMSGNKHFYVFANDGANVIDNLGRATRSVFIANQIAATLDAADDLNLTSPNFLMGTLWSESKLAPSGGTTTNPTSIPLTIGRLVSKVTLNGVSKGTTSNMQGDFTAPVYRLGTIPKKLFLVGNNDETPPLPIPPLAGHGIVTSAVHGLPILTGASDPDFQQYTNTWKNVNTTTPESFYTVENTTEPDNFGFQYYGNTSYIQIRTAYTPDDSEVYNLDLTPRGSFTGPTFYTARLISSGERLIFEVDPASGGADADIDQTTIQVYTNGINYHKFPIHDPEAGLPEVQKNTVLRNHYYLYTVTSIADLGSPDEDVDPTEPIETETTLVIDVTVSPWSKIENTDVPI